MTTAANTIGVRIAAGSDYPRPNMEQVVKRFVLTDDEVRWRVVLSVAVHVMNDGTTRQRMPESSRSDAPVACPRLIVRRVDDSRLERSDGRVCA